VSFGGGFGIDYGSAPSAVPAEFARQGVELLGREGLGELLLLAEPGRSMVGAHGVLVARVVQSKVSGENAWVMIDAGMNDLLRPALYGAIHPITKITRDGASKDNSPRERVDIVGPVCETGDRFLRDWPLGPVATGDLLAIWVTGAYGMSQSSNYNARPRAAEVLVHGHQFRLIRTRETQKDLLRGQLL